MSCSIHILKKSKYHTENSLTFHCRLKSQRS